jgi:AcrR family transcriptional regulator
MNKVHKKHARVREPLDRRERMLVAAQEIIAKDGLRALKVRDVAVASRTSLGGVYLQFADLDALVVAVNRRTLVRLDGALAAAAGIEPRDRIHRLASTYLDFAAKEPNLLRSMFEHRMEERRPFPLDLLGEVNDAFARIAEPLALILTDRALDDVAIIARTMFSAFHGIVTMGIEERMVAVPIPRLREQVELFVDAFLNGLKHGSNRSTA